MSQTKLFGNKRGAAHVEGHGRAAKGARKLTGVRKGVIILAASVLVLALTVFAVYKTFVKPPEIYKDPEPAAETVANEEEAFEPPKVVQIETKINEEGEEVQVETEVPASHKEGFYNILVLGTDDDGTRTDTIMIARLNVNDHTVALMSIPRDTLIQSNMNLPKINGVYGAAGKGENGVKSLKTQLAKLLGFEVDGYAVVNLNAFIELVDLVGGVEFNVPMRMYYSDPTQNLYIDLQAGEQLLDGQHAMQLVRFRKGYATQDIQRTKVQQEFIQALAKKCLNVVNLTKVGEFARIFVDNVLTDLTVGNIAYFGQELLKCDFDKMFHYTLEGEGVYLNGVSYYAIYQNKTLETVNQYFNPYDTDITSANVTILTPDYVRSIQAPKEPVKQDPAPAEQPDDGSQTPDSGDTPENPDQDQPELPTDDWVIEDPLAGGQTDTEE